MTDIKIAYLCRLPLPDETAAPIQMVNTCAALARRGVTVELLSPWLNDPPDRVAAYYGVEIPEGLSLISMRTNPETLGKIDPRLLSAAYNAAVMARLFTSRDWRNFRGKKVLFLRTLREKIYWSFIKRRTRLLNGWTVLYEAHSLDPFTLSIDEAEGKRGIRRLAWPYRLAMLKRNEVRRLSSFDKVVALTQAMADDMYKATDGGVRAEVVHDATLLKPKNAIAASSLEKKEQIVIGYLGQIDQYRGVDVLMESLRYLDDRFVLRIVGDCGITSDRDAQKRPWLVELLDNPLIGAKTEFRPRVPYGQIVCEMENCDIMILAAGSSTKATRHASPLKLFDYLTLGKPIVVAGVDGHREVVTEGENAVLFSRDDPEHLAKRIMEVVENPELARKISEGALQTASLYTYDKRAERLVSIISA